MRKMAISGRCDKQAACTGFERGLITVLASCLGRLNRQTFGSGCEPLSAKPKPSTCRVNSTPSKPLNHGWMQGGARCRRPRSVPPRPAPATPRAGHAHWPVQRPRRISAHCDRPSATVGGRARPGRSRGRSHVPRDTLGDYAYEMQLGESCGLQGLQGCTLRDGVRRGFVMRGPTVRPWRYVA